MAVAGTVPAWPRAGALNAAVAGGSFVSIPATVFAGQPSVAAKASSAVALLPGTLARAWAHRPDLRPFEGAPLRTLLCISFGGGVGTVVTAVRNLLGHMDVKAMSAGRTILVSAANLVAVACFAASGPVHRRKTVVTLVAAVIGGCFGAVPARRLPGTVLRRFVVAFGAAVTAVFFGRACS